MFSYLKALTILRLYSSSTKEERCQTNVDDINTLDMIIDIIRLPLAPSKNDS